MNDSQAEALCKINAIAGHAATQQVGRSTLDIRSVVSHCATQLASGNVNAYAVVMEAIKELAETRRVYKPRLNSKADFLIREVNTVFAQVQRLLSNSNEGHQVMAASTQQRNVQAHAEFQAALRAEHSTETRTQEPDWESVRPAKVYALLKSCKDKHWAEVDSEVDGDGIVLQFSFEYDLRFPDRTPWTKALKIPKSVHLDLPVFCTYEQYREVVDAGKVFSDFGAEFRRRRDQAQAAFLQMPEEVRDSLGVSLHLDFTVGDNF